VTPCAASDRSPLDTPRNAITKECASLLPVIVIVLRGVAFLYAESASYPNLGEGVCWQALTQIDWITQALLTQIQGILVLEVQARAALGILPGRRDYDLVTGRTVAPGLERDASRLELDGVVMQVIAELVDCRICFVESHEVLLISGMVSRTAGEDAEIDVLGRWWRRCLLCSQQEGLFGAFDAVFDALGDVRASKLLIDGVSVT